jgi:hypothetical protein
LLGSVCPTFSPAHLHDDTQAARIVLDVPAMSCTITSQRASHIPHRRCDVRLVLQWSVSTLAIP